MESRGGGQEQSVGRLAGSPVVGGGTSAWPGPCALTSGRGLGWGGRRRQGNERWRVYSSGTVASRAPAMVVTEEGWGSLHGLRTPVGTHGLTRSGRRRLGHGSVAALLRGAVVDEGRLCGTGQTRHACGWVLQPSTTAKTTMAPRALSV
jgi:hypothetical protein